MRSIKNVKIDNFPTFSTFLYNFRQYAYKMHTYAYIWMHLFCLTTTICNDILYQVCCSKKSSTGSSRGHSCCPLTASAAASRCVLMLPRALLCTYLTMTSKRLAVQWMSASHNVQDDKQGRPAMVVITALELEARHHYTLLAHLLQQSVPLSQLVAGRG